MRRLLVCNILIGFILFLAFQAVHPGAARAGTIHHYEYVMTSGFIYVYDLDNGGALVKRVSVPTTAGTRGAVASAASGMLYISYGSDGNNGGFQLAYNLSTDQVAWTMSYSHGIDSQSVSPDGKTIYMPEGELASGGTWYVENSSTGNDIATISTGGFGPHNTIVSSNGLHVYMGDRDYNLPSNSPGVNDFNVASTASNQIIGGVSPLKSGARPFTINSKETFSFNTVTHFLGFQVGDLTTGKVLYTVAVDGSNIPGYTTQTSATIPSHGISLSPDDKEIYLVDQPNSYVHVFDVSGLPANPPVQVADIPLVNQMAGNQSECAYDCLRDGWIQHTRDGRFINVGDSGDVIDTLTRKTIATLPAMLDSRVEIEIDFQDSTPIWAATSRSGVGYTNPQPPNFTARITSPNLGSTVSGTNVAVSTSVIDSVSIASVDLYVDGALYASTTSSPYSFSWDSTKSVNGTHTLMVTANDTAGNTTSFSATFTANNVNTPNPPSITTTSLPGATQNVAYTTTLAAGGGTTPYSWSIVSGSLPAGLALSPSTGAISGTPTGSGTSSFTIQVTDANSQTASKPLSLAVSAATSSPSVTTTSLPGGTQKVGYNATLAANGGTTPYTWSIISGSLPAGLALAPSTGVITGTPTGSGTANFTVQVTDANSQTATKSLSVTVSAAPSLPSVATSSLPSGTQKTSYSATLAATGGTTPYSWSIISGSLPAGLALAPSTGAITGTPTGSGTASFTVQVSDANSQTATKSLSVTVSAAPSLPSVATSSLPSGTQKTSYSATLAATGGTTPYSWSIISGSLPAGLALAPSTGAITGTPTGSGTANFTVQVTDANSQTATKSLSVTVGAVPSLPSVTTTALPNGTQNVSYNATLAATGGTTPYTWSMISGSLPAGLALAPGTGVISGTPTGSGASNFTVQVTDANSQSANKTLSLAVSAAPSITPPSITTTSLPGGTQKAPYNATLSATGGTAPYTWSIVSGSLPAGLALAPSTGAISGTPTGSGSSNFTVQVTDVKSKTAMKSLSVTVTSKAAPTISATSGMQQSTTIGTAFGATLVATVRDGNGQLTAGGTVTFTAPAQTGPSGTFAGGLNTATTNASGVATSAAFTANSISGGPYVVTASVAGAATPATFSLTNDPRLSGSVKAKAGTPQRSIVDTKLPTALQALVTDARGNPVPNVSVTFTAPSSGPSGTFTGGAALTMVLTDASGVATAPTFTANGIAGGPYNVTASPAGNSASAAFSLTNIDFTLAQAAPGTVQLTAGTRASVGLTLATTPTGATFPADVVLSCDVPASTSPISCALNPGKISANSPSGSAAMLTITSTANLAPPSQRKDPQNPYLPWGVATALAGLMAIYFAPGRGTAPSRGRLAYLTLALLAFSSAGLMGCIGLTSAQKIPSSVLVTATSGGVTKTTTVVINVK